MSLVWKFSLFAGIALLLGLGSAWLAVSHGHPLVVSQAGPWQSWRSAGREDADPYTVARAARSGLLPLNSGGALELVATRDSDDRALHARCRYDVAIAPIQALWWSLSAGDSEGRRIPNPASRHAFSSDNTVAGGDGVTHIVLAGGAAPGYWLPSGSDGSLRLTLQILRPLGLDRDGAMPVEALPKIERLGC